MKEITRDMITEFKINKLGYDFMGYAFRNNKELSFHHLIVAHRYCKKMGLGDGYLKWNGAILKQSTSHDYLHLIERIDEEIFWLLTSEMIQENIKGELNIENLKRIRELLLYFESKHQKDEDDKGRKLIKKNIYIIE